MGREKQNITHQKKNPTQNNKSPLDVEILIQCKNRIIFSWSSQQTVGQGAMSLLHTKS